MRDWSERSLQIDWFWGCGKADGPQSRLRGLFQWLSVNCDTADAGEQAQFLYGAQAPAHDTTRTNNPT